MRQNKKKDVTFQMLGLMILTYEQTRHVVVAFSLFILFSNINIGLYVTFRFSAGRTWIQGDRFVISDSWNNHIEQCFSNICDSASSNVTGSFTTGSSRFIKEKRETQSEYKFDQSESRYTVLHITSILSHYAISNILIYSYLYGLETPCVKYVRKLQGKFDDLYKSACT